MHIRAGRVMLASFAVFFLCEGSPFAAGADSPPHVDTSGVNLQPPYPPTALQNQERGAVILGAAVTAEGKVTRVSLIETSGFNDLDSSAISTVLGWRFVPATKEGSPAEGTTMVKLIFGPPAPSPTTAGVQPPAPPSSQPLFPAQLTPSADDGKQATREFAIPCHRGAFEGTVTLEKDARKGGDMARFIVQLAAGNETAQFDIHHIGSRLVGADIVHATNGEAAGGDGYWGSGEMGVPIPVSVGWGWGQVTGNGGLVFGEKRVGFAKDPEKLELITDSGDVAIANARLICLPDHP
jgi:TonB family protein